MEQKNKHLNKYNEFFKNRPLFYIEYKDSQEYAKIYNLLNDKGYSGTYFEKFPISSNNISVFEIFKYSEFKSKTINKNTKNIISYNELMEEGFDHWYIFYINIKN